MTDAETEVERLTELLAIYELHVDRLEFVLGEIGLADALPLMPSVEEANAQVEALNAALKAGEVGAAFEQMDTVVRDHLRAQMPWLTSEAVAAFRKVVADYAPQTPDAALEPVVEPERPRGIDEASMWMLDWMVCGAEPFDEEMARRILGNGPAYDAFVAEVGAAQAKRDARAIDDAGDVGC